MNKLTLLILSIATGFALGTRAEAQVTINGPITVREGLGTGKTIQIPAGQSVTVKDFKVTPKNNNPVGDVWFNSETKSKVGPDGQNYFPAQSGNTTVYISRDSMIQGLTKPVVAADVIDRTVKVNKGSSGGPNAAPPCQNCTHTAGDDTGPFKGEAELRNYACYFRVDKEKAFNKSNLETVMPILVELAASSKVPLAYLACTIQGESSFGVLTNGTCHRGNAPFNAKACHGLGHFEVPTAKAQMPAALELVRPLLQRRGIPEKGMDHAVRQGLICHKDEFTSESAIYQAGLIAAYAQQNVGEKLNGENTNINALLMATAVYRIGSKPYSGVPYSIFQSNNTDWISSARFAKDENLHLKVRTYVRNLQLCMERGNFKARDAGKSEPNRAECGG